jgi:hypothetical protein
MNFTLSRKFAASANLHEGAVVGGGRGPGGGGKQRACAPLGSQAGRARAPAFHSMRPASRPAGPRGTAPA